MKILEIYGLQILDSRGNPTLQVDLLLDDGSKGTFKVPSGASTGIHEAHELRDENKNEYHGKSILKTIENIEEIKPFLIDIDFDQSTLDKKLIEIDGTENKTLLGANTILGISCAFAKAAALHNSQKLYEYISIISNSKNSNNNTNLFANIINGGLHSGNDLKIQEFMIIPFLDSTTANVRAISEIYQTLKDMIARTYGKSQTAVGDEGGFAPNLSTPQEALDLIKGAIIESNYDGMVKIALDCAASDFYNKETKLYEVEKDKQLTYKELTNYYKELTEKYPIISIEDPMDEDDFEGFKYFMNNAIKLDHENPITKNKLLMVVGDDLTVTNPKRIQICIKDKLCNTLLLKINQIGTLSQSIEAYNLAKKNNWEVIVSHRSGETTDSFISDLAIGLNSSIKLGAPARGERVAKYNRLLEIKRYE
jgi:enolase